MDSSSSRKRVLLPQPGQSEAIVRPPSTPRTSSLPRKSQKVTVACSECRAKRTKCDSGKPCFRCVRLGLQCHYPQSKTAEVGDLKRKRQESPETPSSVQQLLTLLKTAPADVAARIVQNLREGVSEDEILQLASSSRLTAAPSQTRAARGASPPTRSSFEFGLNVRHANAFPTVFPLHIGEIDLGLLIHGGRQNSQNKQAKKRRPLLASPPPSVFGEAGYESASPHGSPPPQSNQWVDARLGSLDIHRWTNVPISNSFAAEVLSFYFETEHPIVGVFDPDLFLGDLIGYRTRFCSPLLVSSLLAWACGTYSQLRPEARKLSQSFLDEAKTRWNEEAQRDTLTTVAAAVPLNIACNHHGDDRNGLMYLDAAADMGRRLHLFDEGGTSHWHATADRDKYKTAASFAAWGVFGWHTLHYFYFRRKHKIHDGPTLPIPGDQGGPPMPNYMGETFTWVSKFWRVLHEPSRVGNAIYQNLSLSEAEAMFMKLLGLFDGLPSSLQRGPSCAVHVLVLHGWFHTAILDLWRPFLDHDRHTPLPNFPPVGYTPGAAFNASNRQLQRIAYTYRHRFESCQATSFVSPSFLYLINNVIHGGSETREAQFDFLMSVRGYITLARWSPVLVGVIKGSIGLAWQFGVMQRFTCADDLVKEIQDIPDSTDVEEPEYQSLYPVDIGKPPEDIEEVSMEKLAKGFEKIVLQDRENGKKPETDGAKGGNQPVWTADPRDLVLTLSEATDVDAFVEWDP
ncbi:hypothetical protein QBC47DRAFT_379891 [Echria macrotheca]|uniref:Zn(2)-C6 fungal-type domain-containing protein n=1 Tax=Echria macrotheca TaxID=438768 RepID=A0AAJ0FAK4_9PEZI|nr:hypothetical protein QBC47DRAFT_379891 [Echria macrotheca]